MKIKLVFFLIAASTFGMCTSGLEDPEITPAGEVLQIQSTKTSLRYASLDTTAITVRIPFDAGRLDIKFTTTHGSFIASAAKAVNEYADVTDDKYRYATVLLTSDSSVTKVYVTAEAGAVRERITINFIK